MEILTSQQNLGEFGGLIRGYTDNRIAPKANDTEVVKLNGNQNIAGTKTFDTSPTVPNKTTPAANSGTSLATEAQVHLVASRIDSLDALGHYAGAFDTKASLPTNKNGFANGMTINDFVTIRTDETKDGATIRVFMASRRMRSF
jgi:hypothetical protein